jgi:hypothetical protein
MKLLNLKSPLGSKESPARSCLDLLLDDPEISDGMHSTKWLPKAFSTFGILAGLYWIDPNGGCRSDAVAVHCNYTGEAVKTCLLPEQDTADGRHWTEESIWFSDLSGGFKVGVTNYSSSEGQKHTYYDMFYFVSSSFRTVYPRAKCSC